MTDHPMKQIKVEKLTVNIGCGTDQRKMEKATALIKMLTGIEPVRTKAKTRLAQWGLRKGLPIGVRITLRGAEAEALLKRCLIAKEKRLRDTTFDNFGNVSFGIQEYIDIPDAQYDPNIGIIGLQITATLSRPGYRVSKRKVRPAKVSGKHRVNKEEAQNFFAQNFEVKVEA